MTYIITNHLSYNYSNMIIETDHNGDNYINLELEYKNVSHKTIKARVRGYGFIPKKINIYERSTNYFTAKVIIIDPTNIKEKMKLI